MEYAITLQSQEDYRVINKLLEQALEEARTGQTMGPFHTTRELMEDLLK